MRCGNITKYNRKKSQAIKNLVWFIVERATCSQVLLKVQEFQLQICVQCPSVINVFQNMLTKK